MPPRVIHLHRAANAGLFVALAAASLFAGEPGGARLEELIEQNRRLQEHVRVQQQTIDAISAKMTEVLRASERHDRELRGLQDRGDAAIDTTRPSVTAGAERRGNLVRISAEAGLAFFRTGREGQFPKGEFRADDPVLALEARVWRNAYFYTELKLLPRETNQEDFELGELYVDFEDVLAGWERPGLLNVRAGRLNIPFGEEYLVRGPVANPLISHSLSDTWGCDEGVEIYGRIKSARYVLAVQNGGVSRLRDFNSDKSVAVRVSWDPARWLHVSGSAMRTGRLATVGDNLSELWFGNGFFRALGPAATTSTFQAGLIEADATVRWKTGQVSMAFGQARYDDSDTVADNSRRLNYGYVEGVQSITGPLFAAARFSGIDAPGGYPLAGWGTLGAFFFRPGVLTEGLRRMSVGLGYRFGSPLVLKAEYAWESGRMTTGQRRDHEDFFGTQLGMKF
jgi:hypothetical protein